MADAPRIVRFDGQDAVGPADLVAFWRREAEMPPEVAEQRIGEVHLVALDGRKLVGVSSAYLEYDAQLRLPMWHYRALVAASHRRSAIALNLALAGRDDLRERFVSGADRRAPGILYEVENEELMRGAPDALWMPTDFTFIGENRYGHHVRVHWFPGALAPRPPAPQGST
ncbi:MAG: hypothetical protein M3320_03050 [Actinomycetota bacterium]|nr:hypothetical protein [Actinomycetota bacterium]MDQ5807631.1 hypothetical protein [Actinomycetota bacterium]